MEKKESYCYTWITELGIISIFNHSASSIYLSVKLLVEPLIMKAI